MMRFSGSSPAHVRWGGRHVCAVEVKCHRSLALRRLRTFPEQRPVLREVNGEHEPLDERGVVDPKVQQAHPVAVAPEEHAHRGWYNHGEHVEKQPQRWAIPLVGQQAEQEGLQGPGGWEDILAALCVLVFLRKDLREPGCCPVHRCLGHGA